MTLKAQNQPPQAWSRERHTIKRGLNAAKIIGAYLFKSLLHVPFLCAKKGPVPLVAAETFEIDIGLY